LSPPSERSTTVEEGRVSSDGNHVDADDSKRESGLSENFTPIRCMAAIFTGPTWRGRNTPLVVV
jgi:hypothetical protein